MVSRSASRVADFAEVRLTETSTASSELAHFCELAYCFVPPVFVVRPAREEERMNTFYPEEICVSVAHFEAGLRFPLCHELEDVLEFYGVVLAQITPNSLSTMVAYFSELRSEKLPWNLVVFRKLFALKVIEGIVTFCCNGMKATGLPNKVRDWKKRFVFVGADSPWPIPVRPRMATAEMLVPAKLVGDEINMHEIFHSRVIEVSPWLHPRSIFDVFYSAEPDYTYPVDREVRDFLGDPLLPHPSGETKRKGGGREASGSESDSESESDSTSESDSGDASGGASGGGSGGGEKKASPSVVSGSVDVTGETSAVEPLRASTATGSPLAANPLNKNAESGVLALGASPEVNKPFRRIAKRQMRKDEGLPPKRPKVTADQRDASRVSAGLPDSHRATYTYSPDLKNPTPQAFQAGVPCSSPELQAALDSLPETRRIHSMMSAAAAVWQCSRMIASNLGEKTSALHASAAECARLSSLCADDKKFRADLVQKSVALATELKDERVGVADLKGQLEKERATVRALEEKLSSLGAELAIEQKRSAEAAAELIQEKELRISAEKKIVSLELGASELEAKLRDFRNSDEYIEEVADYLDEGQQMVIAEIVARGLVPASVEDLNDLKNLPRPAS